LFFVVLLSCINNGDESDVSEPTDTTYLNFVNRATGYVTFTEISFQGHKFQLNSQSQRFKVDSEILSGLGEITEQQISPQLLKTKVDLLSKLLITKSLLKPIYKKTRLKKTGNKLL
jgi:hypothetical protein